MALMHIQYWGANQVILQRALAARSLKDAQLGLVVGGFLKYIVAALIIIPPIALVGFHKALEDPDQAYIVLVNTLLAPGVRGLVLMGLFASLMSTVDSIINSVSTLYSFDIYKRHINKDATDQQLGKINWRHHTRRYSVCICTHLYKNPWTRFSALPPDQRDILSYQSRFHCFNPGGGILHQCP